MVTQNRPLKVTAKPAIKTLRDPAPDIDTGERMLAFDGMSNVLSEQAKQQAIALGRLGWSLRRIQDETGVRRETASIYLKAAGIAIPPPDRRKQQLAKPAIPVTTWGSEPAKPAIPVTTGSADSQPTPSASFCEPFREAIELGLRQGRNAMGIWQDLVSQAGFRGGYQTVKCSYASSADGNSGSLCGDRHWPWGGRTG